ncbi:phage tail protein [Emticicia sp. C21]|uniref:phage tail protein n=1 Tax=Emticicia sp. C21 TaxID=2302915 RepID=UPI000E3501C0|nr:tail fiber protein [Emticicia sp. C21]RFS15515.1 phage tail protein [Emticicia sp. C21]
MEGYIAEIRMFAGNFAPRGWAFCQGQLLSIAQNTALFSLLGTTYGGNGQTTFGLPDLRGRVPIGTGQGPGLTSRNLGEVGGSETNTLLISQMPAHIHTLNASANGPTINTANGNLLASQSRSNGGTMPNVYAPNSGAVPMGGSAIGVAGGSQPVNNIQPYLGINFIICMEGIYPSRN